MVGRGFSLVLPLRGRQPQRKVAAAILDAGMRPLLWSDFFKSSDLPLQELDRLGADADGAVLVGTADDRVESRGHELQQMRDNVLFEYGLFAGRLGRHRCILLMPDKPHFKIPSDFLGVAGFEWYSKKTIDGVVRNVPERLQAGLAADGFLPPSLKERGRRLLMLTGWIRGEIGKVRTSGSKTPFKRKLVTKAEVILCFLKEDIEYLGLRGNVDELVDTVKKSIKAFPEIPNIGKLKYQLQDHIQSFFRDPDRLYLPSRMKPESRRYAIGDLLGRGGHDEFYYSRANRVCPWCQEEGRCVNRSDRPYHRYPREMGYCPFEAYNMGAIDMLAHLDSDIDSIGRTIEKLDDWYQKWLPKIVNQLGSIDTAIHKRVFGHL